MCRDRISVYRLSARAQFAQQNACHVAVEAPRRQPTGAAAPRTVMIRGAPARMLRAVTMWSQRVHPSAPSVHGRNQALVVTRKRTAQRVVRARYLRTAQRCNKMLGKLNLTRHKT